MLISLIVAHSLERVIGHHGDLPWSLPDDLRRFRTLTWGKPILMGRRTHASIGRTLPGRVNIVLTRDPDLTPYPGARIANGPQQALDLARQSIADGEENPEEEVVVIGGAMIYQLFLPLARRIYLTIVQANVEGDTHFPDIPMGVWKSVTSEHVDADTRNEHAFTVHVLEKGSGVLRRSASRLEAIAQKKDWRSTG